MSEPGDDFEQPLSRYIVGIDLGTTNCAVAYADTHRAEDPIRCFPVTQWVDLGVREPRELLPSFLYQPLDSELPSVNGQRFVVGQLAWQRGSQLPGRAIASAKSWLCHGGVDRGSPILPWQSDAGVEKLSPVAASAAYLQQIREAWDQAHPADPLAQQDIVLTLPASFDQVARQLTIEAARQAGLQRVMPIEEPQAAFYAWLARHANDWESRVQAGQTILVCDIGGGTTDFTLIRVRAVGAGDGLPDEVVAGRPGDSSAAVEEQPSAVNPLHQQRLTLHRVAVGQHLILGGDNIDLALARMAEAKCTAGQTLPPRDWEALLAACRSAKEALLGPAAPERFTIHLPGAGSRLIGGGRQVEVTRDEVRQAVLEGFFPSCSLGARPDEQPTGFQEFGLPYARDAAVTRHLAAFLMDQRAAGRPPAQAARLSELEMARPDWILFNGGVMSSGQLTERLVAVVASWFAGTEGVPAAWRPGVLAGERLDLAVAYGAAYWGRVRRGIGVEIDAKLACSYYLQVASDPPMAVCMVPGSARPGDHFQLDQPFELMIGEPVEFPIWYSSLRLADEVGQSVEIVDDQFTSLPAIRTVVQLPGSRRRELLPVRLQVELTEVGTLQLWCRAVNSGQRWRLEFDIRGSTRTDWQAKEAIGNRAGVLEDTAESAVRGVLERVFGSAQPPTKPAKVVAELSQAVGLKRHQWPPPLLRAMWRILMELSAGRGRTAEHEARWLNLVGYALRPGWGMAADDWRVAETWRQVHGKLIFASPSSRNEALILWRRIAGGFTPGQQLTVFQQIAGPLRQTFEPARRGPNPDPQQLIELLRLSGALELLPQAIKCELGDRVLGLLDVARYRTCHGAVCWCLARLGTRQPAYGPLNGTVPTADVERWLQSLLNRPVADPHFDLALMQCARKTGDRYRDVDSRLRGRVAECLETRGAAPHYAQLVRDGGKLASEETAQVLGDSLPLGLQWRG